MGLQSKTRGEPSAAYALLAFWIIRIRVSSRVTSFFLFPPPPACTKWFDIPFWSATTVIRMCSRGRHVKCNTCAKEHPLVAEQFRYVKRVRLIVFDTLSYHGPRRKLNVLSYDFDYRSTDIRSNRSSSGRQNCIDACSVCAVTFSLTRQRVTRLRRSFDGCYCSSRTRVWIWV
jgi:hypothetical protein